MKKYECHKIVEAMKIVKIEIVFRTGGGATIHGDGEGFVSVSDAYMAKHHPVKGGYYVKYADGYESFSPAEVFEDGYTEVL